MLREKRVTPVRQRVAASAVPSPLGKDIREFLEWTVAVGLSPDTARIRHAALGRFAAWCGTQALGAVRQIDRSGLEAYQAHLAAYRKADGQLIASSTRASRMNPVIAFCRWLARQGRVADDPARGLVLSRHVRRLPGRVPTVAEVEAILARPSTATPSGIRDRAILETLYSTALRRMELVRLLPQDLDLRALVIFVRTGKGGRDRVVPLGARAGRWIDRYLREVRGLLSSPNGKGPLFLTDYGEAFAKNRLGDLVRRHVTGSGFPGRGSCHLFRHACATHMLENGADIRFIQAMLGHAQLSSTEVYTRVSIAKLREVHAATHPSR